MFQIKSRVTTETTYEVDTETKEVSIVNIETKEEREVATDSAVTIEEKYTIESFECEVPLTISNLRQGIIETRFSNKLLWMAKNKSKVCVTFYNDIRFSVDALIGSDGGILYGLKEAFDIILDIPEEEMKALEEDGDRVYLHLEYNSDTDKLNIGLM